MLAVAVDTHRKVVAVLEGEAKAGLHRAADTEVERQPQHARTLAARDPRRPVDGAVVDDDDVQPGIEGAQLVDHASDRVLLVQRGDDRDALQLTELRIGRRRSSCGDELAHRAEGSAVTGGRGRAATRRR